MVAVSSRQITWRGGKPSTEASDLGWRAGHWPEQVEVKSTRTGAVATFRKIAHVLRFGELQGVRYVAKVGGRPINLMVFND